MTKEPERGFEPLTITLISILAAFGVFMGLCFSEYDRNFRATWQTLVFVDHHGDAAETMRGSYYYCLKHTPGRDPQLLDMQARSFGWVEVRCPFCLAADRARSAQKLDPPALVKKE